MRIVGEKITLYQEIKPEVAKALFKVALEVLPTAPSLDGDHGNQRFFTLVNGRELGLVISKPEDKTIGDKKYTVQTATLEVVTGQDNQDNPEARTYLLETFSISKLKRKTDKKKGKKVNKDKKDKQEEQLKLDHMEDTKKADPKKKDKDKKRKPEYRTKHTRTVHKFTGLGILDSQSSFQDAVWHYSHTPEVMITNSDSFNSAIDDRAALVLRGLISQVAARVQELQYEEINAWDAKLDEGLNEVLSGNPRDLSSEVTGE